MIADYDGDISTLFETKVEGPLPILATRNIVLFPGVIIPIIIGRESSVNLVEKLKDNPEQIFGVFCQKSTDIEQPVQKDLHEYGVYAKLVRVIDMPGPQDHITVIVQALGRCHLDSITRHRPYLVGTTTLLPEEMPDARDKSWRTAIEDLRAKTVEYIHQNEDIPDESQFALNNIQNNVLIMNFICTNLPFSVGDKMKMLQADSMMDRVIIVLKTLNKEIQLLQLRQDIRTKTREDIDEQQREYFLQQQIKNIKEELGNGDGSPERHELETKALGKNWPEDVEKVFFKELDKLDMLNPQGPEYSVQMNYLQTMVNLPWGEYTHDNLDLKRAQKILDHDHYGMEKVKERILEYMAVLQLRGDLKSPIICLYGPPGVGKTSLGKSIAAAMKRKYVRVSWVVCTTRARFADIAAPMWELCPVVSSSQFRRLDRRTRYSSSTKSTRLHSTPSTATRHRQCSKCSILSRTRHSTTTTSMLTTTSRKCSSSQQPITSAPFPSLCSTVWKSSR